MAYLLDEYDYRTTSDGRSHLYYLVYHDKPLDPTDLPEDLGDTPILTVDLRADQIIVHCHTISPGPPFVLFGLRYPGINQIVLEGFGTGRITDEESALSFIENELPKQFRTDLEDGMGLLDPYTPLIEEIHKGCEAHRLVISKKRMSEFLGQDSDLILSEREFLEACNQIDEIDRLAWDFAYREKLDAVFNKFAPFMAKQDRRRITQNEEAIKDIVRLLSEAATFDSTERNRLAHRVSETADDLVETNSDAVEILKDGLDLALLDAFIERFENRLNEDLSESDWQTFFTDHPIALANLFNSSVVMISDRPYVGGKDIDGRGGKHSDFLYQNVLSGNLSFVEIKTPEKKLVQANDSYTSGLHPAHSDLSLAVSQVMLQRNKFQDQFANAHLESPQLNLKSYAIRCFVVIGKMPTDEPSARSFEHVRDNFKHVTVVTFDEVVSRLKQFRTMLAVLKPV